MLTPFFLSTRAVRSGTCSSHLLDEHFSQAEPDCVLPPPPENCLPAALRWGLPPRWGRGARLPTLLPQCLEWSGPRGADSQSWGCKDLGDPLDSHLPQPSVLFLLSPPLPSQGHPHPPDTPCPISPSPSPWLTDTAPTPAWPQTRAGLSLINPHAAVSSALHTFRAAELNARACPTDAQSPAPLLAIPFLPGYWNERPSSPQNISNAKSDSNLQLMGPSTATLLCLLGWKSQ